MITLTDKIDSLNNAKAISSALAKDYIRKKTYGYPDIDKCLHRLSVIRTLILEIEKYSVVDSGDFYDWGILNLGGKKIILSENNLLPLKAGNDKYQIQNDEINCITEQDYCKILDRIEVFSQSCSC